MVWRNCNTQQTGNVVPVELCACWEYANVAVLLHGVLKLRVQLHTIMVFHGNSNPSSWATLCLRQKVGYTGGYRENIVELCPSLVGGGVQGHLPFVFAKN